MYSILEPLLITVSSAVKIRYIDCGTTEVKPLLISLLTPIQIAELTKDVVASGGRLTAIEQLVHCRAGFSCVNEGDTLRDKVFREGDCANGVYHSYWRV